MLLRRPVGILNLLLLHGKNKQDILKCTTCSTTISTIITPNYETKVALFQSKVCQEFIEFYTGAADSGGGRRRKSREREERLSMSVSVDPSEMPPWLNRNEINTKYQTVVYLKYPARTQTISFSFTFPLTLHLDCPVKLRN
jgi:hypothetical protein